MTSVTHALIGAAIAARITDPATAAVFAFTTHFVCDAIPHWDLGTNRRLRPKKVTGTFAVVETLVAFSTYFLFAPYVASQAALAAAIFFSILPDLLQAPYYIFKHPPQISVAAHDLQSYIHSRAQLPFGVITQVVVAGLFLYVGFGL